MVTALKNFEPFPANFRFSDSLIANWTLAPKWAPLIAKHDPTATRLANLHKRLREGGAVIEKELRRQPVTVTPQRHYLDTNEAAQRWFTAMAKEIDAAQKAANSRLGELDTEIEAKMHSADDRYTDKLRDRIYGMKLADRQAFAMAAIESGDRAKMAAFMNGDAILCGFTDDQQKALRTHATQTHAGELLEEKDGISYANQIIFNSTNDMITALGTLFSDEKLSLIKAEANAISASYQSLAN